MAYQIAPTTLQFDGILQFTLRAHLTLHVVPTSPRVSGMQRCRLFRRAQSEDIFLLVRVMRKMNLLACRAQYVPRRSEKRQTKYMVGCVLNQRPKMQRSSAQCSQVDGVAEVKHRDADIQW